MPGVGGTQRCSGAPRGAATARLVARRSRYRRSWAHLFAAEFAVRGTHRLTKSFVIECDLDHAMSRKGRPMTNGPGGDPSSGLDYEETEHAGRVVRIASVAALGGFLFGYDSAVINGAVSAVQDHFQVDNATLGFAVASALLG